MALSITQLRDRLGRELVKAPDQPVLHGALRVLTRAFTRDKDGELSRWQRLTAARATALALDVVAHAQQRDGEAVVFLSDALNPANTPALAWWIDATRPGAQAELATMLDAAREMVRTGDAQAATAVSETLERAYASLERDMGRERRASGARALGAGLLGAAVGFAVSRVVRRRA